LIQKQEGGEAIGENALSCAMRILHSLSIFEV
jgi:hypothetical protein